MFDKIPYELKQLRQWVVWRYEERGGDKPTKVPYSANTDSSRASVSDPSTFSAFDDAVNAVAGGFYDGIGFVLTQDDPYTFIDLDDTKGDTQLYETQREICSRMNSYTELSPSKTGVHIIVKGSTPSGRKRNSVEVYSSARFMTMTGDHLNGCNYIIEDRSEQVTELYNILGGEQINDTSDVNSEQTKTDDEIVDIASNAENGEKFMRLHAGDWQSYYSSQSEGDFAYIDILAFYTQNREQIMRMFRASPLGQRFKAQRDDYVNWMINKSFDNILPPVNISALMNQMNEALERNKQQEEREAEPVEIVQSDSSNVYTVPDGLLGEIARFVYAQAPRPVPEIALAAAIGLMAGICGRSYNISGTGLNQYVMLLAGTGTGKEAISSGIGKLMGQVATRVVSSDCFVGPTKFASPQALTKYLANNSASFVSVYGEIGLMLQRMCDPKAPAHLQGLRESLLDLYNKSGYGQVLGSSVYSDKEKNVTKVNSPAFTLLGESTQERFYEALDEEFVNEGLISRFMIIDYVGYRPPFNPEHSYVKPPTNLIERLSELCAQSVMINGANNTVPMTVRMDDEALSLLNQFNLTCDSRINDSGREALKQVWNRAHIKALKLSALVAVGCHPYEPTITGSQAQWAIDIVTKDVMTVISRFESGEVGAKNFDNEQLRATEEAIRQFFTKEDVKRTYKIRDDLFNDRIIPYSYFQRKLVQIACFRKTGKGTFHVKNALKTLCDMGVIVELGKGELIKKYDFKGIGYMISDLNYFGFG